MNNEKKLKGRDLINIGIYGAIYFVILFAVAMLGMIPVFLPLLSVFVPILGGIPFMLFLTRVSAYTTAIFEPVVHGYSMEEAYRCLETLEAFFLPGWKQLLGF